MKNIRFISAFSLLLLLTSFSLHSFGQTGDINVTVTNLKNTDGYIFIGLFNKADDFPIDGKQYRKDYVKVSSKTFTYTFKNIPAGDYAIAVYHDENADHKCNRNMMGIPTERYGFSNNIKPVLSAPSFSKVKFNLVSSVDISIRLFD
ncbi:MAG: DUF2141 domain-containing protein [Bacteroidetes bacterium]|nr:DUF2141 domain-containing protein [Bacteroidota bacterium]MBP7398528.1 DUF2141 domain-containing protein [Chitinophagales bacterium]MBK7109451.1 DUF2141 domain-containing protein [Bacteroidota bacterium]MBK8487808.1 DUF2141 domain-containing protein [Bacteroidota bacterium]MBK8682437.1 DUF2141 domain-containing protein [Bacteroidota bacterium]